MFGPKTVLLAVLVTSILLVCLSPADARKSKSKSRSPMTPTDPPELEVDSVCVANFTAQAIFSLGELILMALGECVPICQAEPTAPPATAAPTAPPSGRRKRQEDISCGGCFLSQLALFAPPSIPENCFQ